MPSLMSVLFVNAMPPDKDRCVSYGRYSRITRDVSNLLYPGRRRWPHLQPGLEDDGRHGGIRTSCKLLGWF